MSTMKFDPSNLLILAAVGIGAYWLLVKKGRAKTAAPIPPYAYTTRASGGNPANRPTAPNWTQGLMKGIDAYISGNSQAPQLPGSFDANPTNPSTSYLEATQQDVSAINGFV